jgi:putative spermidine/putrescine transport system ATP-binding protein
LGGAYLRLSNVVKSYDGRSNAVDNISIDIGRGQFVTFLGPSGSGKTTTLMMIAGFELATSGTIELDGRDLTGRKPYERNIGVVFQSYALFPHMSTAKNVGFPLKMRGVRPREIKERVERVLALVGLGAFASKHPRELSGGQQQRVALARALVFNPDILLLDEPLGALDKNLREQMQVEIKRIQREVGITTIYVTHDQTEAMTMSDLVAVYCNGRLEQVAPPLDIYRRPATRFVGQFIGDSNFFQARRAADRPGWIDIEGLGPARLEPDAWAKLPPADPVNLLIRPEQFRLVEGTADGAMNLVAAKVRDVVNTGDSALVIADVNGTPVRVRLVGVEAERLGAGAALRLGWWPKDAHAVKA